MPSSRADRARYDLLAPEGIDFPDHVPTRTCTLDADVVTVGRTSVSRGIHPDIDLSGPPEDPGVSREHLRLERTADARYAVVDCGSANGTTLNDDLTAHPTGDAGATVRRRPDPPRRVDRHHRDRRRRTRLRLTRRPAPRRPWAGSG